MRFFNHIVSVIIISIFCSSCVFSPGMDMKKSMRKGDGLVYAVVQGIENPIPIIDIDEDVVNQLSVIDSNTKIPAELITESGDLAYKVGVSDILSVVVWGQPELVSVGGGGNNPLIMRQVRDDGTFFFPYAGKILADGLTRERIRVDLTRKLDRYFQDPQVDVAIEQYNSQFVVLSGQFNSPEILPITAVPLTLSQAISTAGGPSEMADLTDLRINRDGKLYRLNYYKLANKGVIHNLILKDGDVVHFPINQSNSAYVIGEVGKPQKIQLTTGRITLTDALATAQGLARATSSGNEVYIVRGVDTVAGEKAIYKLEANSPAAYLLASQFVIQPQDVIFVGPAELTKWNRVVSQIFPFARLLDTAQRVD